MKLATVRYGDTLRVGVVQDEGVYPIGSEMSTLIEAMELHTLQNTVGRMEAVPLSDVQLLAPIPRPRQNIICLGKNYLEHAGEMQRARGGAMGSPTFFTKAVTSVIGPDEAIPYDSAVTQELDWEVELACVIGRTARRVSPEQALDHVFGYLILNDLSARDLQYGHGGQFFYGKSLDGSCPIGPWIVTRDEIPDPQVLGIRLTVNGVTKQSANTESMIFGVAETISHLSRAMTLLPGQIIATGTPSGVGYARDPKEFLRPGDIVECQIDAIGSLRNTVGPDRAV